MRYFVKVVSLILILGFPNLVKSNQIIPHFNDNNEIWSAPFKQRWHFSDLEPINLPPVQTSNEIAIPNANGKVVKLDSVSGNFIWRSDLGGEINYPLLIDDKKIYIVTSSTKVENDNITDNKELNSQPLLVLRAISIQNGITIWQNDLANQDLISFEAARNKLILGFRNGDIFSLNKETGSVIWQKHFDSGFDFPFSVLDEQIFLINKNNQLFSLSTNGESVKKIAGLPAAPLGKSFVSNNYLWFSDRFGTVYTVRLSDGKLLWYSRTGGEIKSMLLVSNILLVASQDNYVYAFSPEKGKKQWKLKLSSRPLDILNLDEKKILISTFGSNKMVLVDVSAGKIINQIVLPADEFPISNPLLTKQESIIVTTQSGVKSFSAQK